MASSSIQRTGEFAKVDISLSMCTQKGVHQARHKWVLAVEGEEEILNNINNAINNEIIINNN